MQWAHPVERRQKSTNAAADAATSDRVSAGAAAVSSPCPPAVPFAARCFLSSAPRLVCARPSPRNRSRARTGAPDYLTRPLGYRWILTARHARWLPAAGITPIVASRFTTGRHALSAHRVFLSAGLPACRKPLHCRVRHTLVVSIDALIFICVCVCSVRQGYR